MAHDLRSQTACVTGLGVLEVHAPKSAKHETGFLRSAWNWIHRALPTRRGCSYVLFDGRSRNTRGKPEGVLGIGCIEVLARIQRSQGGGEFSGTHGAED